MQKKILIVDDNLTFTRLLSDALSAKPSYMVETASDGEEGLQKALNSKPDLILLDLVMPKMGGIEVLKKLRQDKSFDATQIYILTQLADEQKMVETVSLKVRGYILKAEQSIMNIVDMVETALQSSP